jgi:hypothetical protein
MRDLASRGATQVAGLRDATSTNARERAYFQTTGLGLSSPMLFVPLPS